MFVDGTPVHKLSQDKLAKWRGRRVGVIFQFFQLLPTLTVLENLMLPMDFCNTYARRERKARALQLLEQVELVDQANKLPSSLSGGQQQRVAIARALANDPPILVADEPTGNLDSKTADSVFRMFESLVDQGKTILMVTHDRDLAERVTRTVIISDGEIIEEYLAKAFPGLTEQQLVQAMRQLDRQTFPPGATVIREGAPPENFYIITEGEVEVHLRAPNGEEFVVARMGRGQYVGEIELLRGGNSIATVRASVTTGAEVAMLDPGEFAALMAESQAAKEAVAHIAEDRLAEHEAAVAEELTMIRPRWRKILRDIWRNKRRTVLVVLSIAVGVFAVGTVAIMRDIVTGDMVASYEAANPPNAILYIDGSFDDKMVESVKRIPQVAEAEGRRQIYVRFQHPQSETWYAMRLYAAPDYENMRIGILRRRGSLRL